MRSCIYCSKVVFDTVVCALQTHISVLIVHGLAYNATHGFTICQMSTTSNLFVFQTLLLSSEFGIILLET